MSDDTTQRYIDGEKNWISTVTGRDSVIEKKITGEVSIIEEIDIDIDIEKQITQLQEAKIQVAKSEVNLLTNISKKQAKEEINVQKELGDFFSTISSEKQELTKKIDLEEVKIAEVEKLFNSLSAPKKKKKIIKEKLIVKPKKVEELIIEEEIVVEKTPEELTFIEKVSKQLSDMKVSKKLDEDKIRSLESVDTLDKLKREFLNFKDVVAKQMSFTGGGLDPNKISADLVPTTANTFSLGSANRPWKDLHLSGSSLIIGGVTMDSTELTVLDGVTTGTVAAGRAVIVDSSLDITGFRNVTATGTSTFGSLSDGSITITAFVDEDNMVSNSATLVPTQQSVKAYVDSSSGVLNFTTDDEQDENIQLASEIMLFAGGTGMETSSDGNTITVSIDSSVATKNFSIAQAIALG